jgi:hypothetical protein
MRIAFDPIVAAMGFGLMAALILTPNRGAQHASPSAQAAVGWPGRPLIRLELYRPVRLVSLRPFARP